MVHKIYIFRFNYIHVILFVLFIEYNLYCIHCQWKKVMFTIHKEKQFCILLFVSLFLCRILNKIQKRSKNKIQKD